LKIDVDFEKQRNLLDSIPLDDDEEEYSNFWIFAAYFLGFN